MARHQCVVQHLTHASNVLQLARVLYDRRVHVYLSDHMATRPWCCATSSQRDAIGAQVKVVGFLEGEPRTVVELQTSQEVATLGEALSIDEQEFLAAEINRHLQREGQTVTTENDVALPSNLPYDPVINDSFDVMGNRPSGRAFRRNRLMDSWDD